MALIPRAAITDGGVQVQLCLDGWIFLARPCMAPFDTRQAMAILQVTAIVAWIIASQCSTIDVDVPSMIDDSMMMMKMMMSNLDDVSLWWFVTRKMMMCVVLGEKILCRTTGESCERLSTWSTLMPCLFQ